MLKPLEAKCITTLQMIQFWGRGGGWGGIIHTHREKISAAEQPQLFHLIRGRPSG